MKFIASYLYVAVQVVRRSTVKRAWSSTATLDEEVEQCLFLLINLVPAMFKWLTRVNEVETRKTEQSGIDGRALLGSG